MKTQISRWGNSLALRIPRAFAQETRLEEGTTVELSVSDGRIVVSPVGRPYRLDELVAGITPENRYAETDWGEPLGNETW